MMSSPFKPEALAGKVAIVTGGGSGICYEITKQLLLHGCIAAIICGRRENFLQKAAKEITVISNRECLYKVCDVRDPLACKAVVEFAMSQFGRVDILINGAAGNFLAEAKSLTPKGFKTVMDIDTQGTFNMCHAVFPAMSNGGRGGSIINISMTLHYGATWYQAHASAAKSAIDSLTRSLALEWGCHKIRVNGSEYNKHLLLRLVGKWLKIYILTYRATLPYFQLSRTWTN
jgi:peroxisomal 2,4-dienoyl-CoA reductase